jgi:hypothetical protein
MAHEKIKKRVCGLVFKNQKVESKKNSICDPVALAFVW